MRILQLCKKFPFPVRDGEALAITNLSRALQAFDCEVSMLAMNTVKHFAEPDDLPADHGGYRRIETAEVDNRVRPWPAFLNLFSKESYHLSRFWSPAFADRLRAMLEADEYDYIQLETLYLTPYIPLIRAHSRARIALRAHNVEHEIWQRVAANTHSQPKRWYLRHLTEKLERYERKALQEVDLLIPITGRDLDNFRRMGYTGEAVVVPIGIDSDRYRPDDRSFQRELSASFIGSLDWIPNQEGLKWLLQEVWGPVVARHPEMVLHVAGRNPPAWVQDLAGPNVQVHGEVSDAVEFINRHSLMIVPLLAGSGMRVKILEGMALGKVVLTTSVGLEGIAATQREEALIADTPDQFAAAIEWCYGDRDRLRQIGRRARQLIRLQYDNLTTTRQLKKAYDRLLVGAS